jgi:hypothetical protein
VSTAPLARSYARGLVLLAILVAASTLFLKLADPDLFGHIRTGQWMVLHHSLVREDPFSYASDGPVRYTPALAEVAFYAVDHAFGARGLNVLHVCLVALLLLLVLARSPGSAASQVLVTAFILVGSFAALTLKPQVFSYLLFALLLLVLEGAPSVPPRRLFFLPILFFLWANLHRGGVFGIAVLAAVTLSFGTAKSTRAHTAALAGVLALSCLALLLNEGGAYYVTSAFDVLGRASFHARIAEWQPLTPGLLLAKHAALIPLVILAGLERALRRRFDAELVVIVCSLALATLGARLLPFVAIAVAPAAVRALERLRDLYARRARPIFLDTLLVVVGFVLPPFHYVNEVPRGYRGLGIEDSVVPVALADLLRSHRPRGNLFHSFDFGGYFLYTLAPETKVLIDGRNDTVYSDRLFEQATDAETVPAAFDELDARYSFSAAAFGWEQLGDRRGAFLAERSGWVLAYWDDLSTLYVNKARDPELAATLGYSLHVTTVLDLATHPTEGDEDARFMKDLRRNVRDAPQSARAHGLLGVALRSRGQVEEAMQEERESSRLLSERLH